MRAELTIKHDEVRELVDTPGYVQSGVGNFALLSPNGLRRLLR